MWRAADVLRRMSMTTRSKNRKYIERGKFIKVLIRIKKTDDPAKLYSASNFPTFLLLVDALNYYPIPLSSEESGARSCSGGVIIPNL